MSRSNDRGNDREGVSLSRERYIDVWQYLAAHRGSSNKGDVQQGNNKRNAARAGKVNIELQVPAWAPAALHRSGWRPTNDRQTGVDLLDEHGVIPERKARPSNTE
jgi:hypothetical protein